MVNLIRLSTPKKFSFYILGDFNLPNIDWNIPSTTFNDCNINFIKFFSDNHFTQFIDSQTHKDGNIFDYCFVIVWVWIELSFIRLIHL